MIFPNDHTNKYRWLTTQLSHWGKPIIAFICFSETNLTTYPFTTAPPANWWDAFYVKQPFSTLTPNIALPFYKVPVRPCIPPLFQAHEEIMRFTKGLHHIQYESPFQRLCFFSLLLKWIFGDFIPLYDSIRPSEIAFWGNLYAYDPPWAT